MHLSNNKQNCKQFLYELFCKQQRISLKLRGVKPINRRCSVYKLRWKLYIFLIKREPSHNQNKDNYSPISKRQQACKVSSCTHDEKYAI